MRVERIMSMPAITCSVHDALNRPAQLMWEQDVGIVAVAGEDGRLVGVITDRDIAMAAYTSGQPLVAIPVTAAMAHQVFTCQPDDLVEVAETIMRDHQVRRVPVVNSEGSPLGLISLNDVSRHTAHQRNANGAEHEIVRTLAAVSEPRRSGQRTGSRALASISEQAAAPAE